MGRISNYASDASLSDDDQVLGTNGEDNSTKNFSLGALKSYVGAVPLAGGSHKIYSTDLSSSQTISASDLEEYSLFFIDNTSSAGDLVITLSDVSTANKTVVLVSEGNPHAATNRILVKDASSTLIDQLNIDNNLYNEAMSVIWTSSGWRHFR